MAGPKIGSQASARSSRHNAVRCEAQGFGAVRKMAVRVLAHAHTTYSGDGELTPDELATLAVSNGFQAVLVSDHFEDLTADSFARLVQDCRAIKRCLMIPGYERSWRGYHVLALGVENWFDDETIASWAARLHATGALIAMAHPGRYKYDVPPDVLSVCDAVEVWNSKRGYDGSVGPNPRAYRLLGARRRALCGQDLHGTRHATTVALDIPKVRVELKDVLNALHEGNYRIANGSYAFDGELPLLSRLVLSAYHSCRGPAISMAVRVAKIGRKARRMLPRSSNGFFSARM